MWWPVYCISAARAEEAQANCWLGCGLAQHPWPSCGSVFYGIWSLKHDLGCHCRRQRWYVRGLMSTREFGKWKAAMGKIEPEHVDPERAKERNMKRTAIVSRSTTGEVHAKWGERGLRFRCWPKARQKGLNTSVKLSNAV